MTNYTDFIAWNKRARDLQEILSSTDPKNEGRGSKRTEAQDNLRPVALARHQQDELDTGLGNDYFANLAAADLTEQDIKQGAVTEIMHQTDTASDLYETQHSAIIDEIAPSNLEQIALLIGDKADENQQKLLSAYAKLDEISTLYQRVQDGKPIDQKLEAGLIKQASQEAKEKALEMLKAKGYSEERAKNGAYVTQIAFEDGKMDMKHYISNAIKTLQEKANTEYGEVEIEVGTTLKDFANQTLKTMSGIDASKEDYKRAQGLTYGQSEPDFFENIRKRSQQQQQEE